MPGNGMQKNAMPGNGIQKNVMPGNGIQKNLMPAGGIQKNAMPGDGIQERIRPVKPRLTREQIARRAARELPDGAYVNLGCGMPNLIAHFFPKEITVDFYRGNRILGMVRPA